MAGIPPVIDVTNIYGSNGFRILGSSSLEEAGSSVSVGDINGDGIADVIVGAPGRGFGSNYSAYVIFGRGSDDIPSASTVSTANLDPIAGFRMVVGEGYAVSYAGDFNGDGIGDFMVSAPSYGTNDQGATYVVFGNAGGTPNSQIRIDGGEAAGIVGDRSGYSVAALGDVNGDGFDDVLIGSPGAAGDGRWASGVTYVVYGNASGANIDLANFNASEGFRIIGSEFESIGHSVSAAGDVNGDGRMDLLIGVSTAGSDGNWLAGSTYLVYGSDSGADVDLANLTPSQGVRFDGEFESESGFSVSAAGDVNGDGLADIIIGAPSPSSFPGQGGGSAFVVFGKTGGLSNMDLANLGPGDGFRINGAAVGDEAGYSVSSAGDFNGDGYGDLIIGAPYADPDGRTDAGSAYVIFGKASGFGDIDLANLSAADGFRIDGPSGVQGNLGFELPNHLGFSVAAGDINDDGYSDVVVGTPGYSLVEGATYVIYGEPSGAVNKVGTSGDDRLFGGDFDDTLSGGDGNDVLGGKGGNNVLTGGAGSDAVVYALSDQHNDGVTDFRQGEDVIDLRAANISDFATVQQLLSNDAQGNAVITTVSNGVTSTMTLTGISAAQLTAADFTFAGNSTQTLNGSDSADDLFGGAGGDILKGNAGDDRLFGEQGYDSLNGGAGNDSLFGGQDSDSLEGGAGADLFDGGAGIDEATYRTALAGVTVSLASGGTGGDAAGDAYVSIENMWGSNFECDMGGIEHFDGGDGVDLVAYLGVPVELVIDPTTYSYVITGEGVTVDLADSSRNTGFAAGDTYASIEVLIGSYVNDNLAGDEQDNILRGSYGDDVIWGRGGNDLLEGDVGNDRLIGGAGADVLYGNVDFLGYLDLVGRLLGPIGADLIQQAKDMAAGDPEFGAGDGFDVASYETATSGVIASLSNPAINTGDAAGDTYILIEGLAGSAFDDTLIGTAGWGAEGHNTLEGGAGNDTLIGLGGDDDYDGGAGDDTAVLSENRAAYTITYDAATLTFALTAGVSVNHVKGVETLQFADVTLSVASLFAGGDNDDSLTGTAGQDDLNGGGGNDTLRGLGGDDRFDGGSGDDQLSGGDGNDTLIGGIGRDAASYADATAAVRVDLGASGAQAAGGGGTDTLTGIEDVVGSAFGDTLIGNAGDNALRGGGGDDLLIGLGGNDTFDGGAGIDTVSFADVNSVTTVDLALTGPQSVGGFEGLDTFVNVENVVASMYWGGTLKGDSGANWLTGGINPSTLMGRGGDDVLDGHNGWQDTASYAEASTGVTVDLAISGPQNTGEGSDTLIDIEHLTGSAFGDTLKGTSGDNVLTGGAGDDTLFGRGGYNRLDGGDGIDTVFYADATTGVQVNLNPGSYYNPDVLISIENVVGSAFADVLTGDAGANALIGGGGSDVLTGGLGRDTLTGGADRDVFDFNALNETPVGAGARDVITDFQSGLDDIDLTGIDANTGRSGDQGFRFIGTKGFTGKEGELRYQTFDQAGTANDITVVSGDINGDRVADFELQIVGIVNLASSDFLL